MNRERPSDNGAAKETNELTSCHGTSLFIVGRAGSRRTRHQGLGPRQLHRLQQGFATGEMGSKASLQSSNPEPLMSAMGQ
jgi:hypothetical protein